jgi:hypothetical protein
MKSRLINLDQFMKIECKTKEDINSLSEGDIAIIRKGFFILGGLIKAELHGTSSAALYESSSAALYESSSAALYDSSDAVLYDSSSAVLYDSSDAVLYESSSAALYDSSSAVLHDSSSAKLWSSSRAILHGSSSAALCGSSSAELWNSSSAELYDSSKAIYKNIASISKTPISILGMMWPVFIFDYHIKIGCKLYLTEEWKGFTDEQINRFDKNAIEFWKKNKSAILAIAKTHQTYEENL